MDAAFKALPPALIIAAAELQDKQPQLWADFIAGLELQFDKTTVLLMQADPTNILRHQGQVQAMSVLIEGLRQARLGAALKPGIGPAQRK